MRAAATAYSYNTQQALKLKQQFAAVLLKYVLSGLLEIGLDLQTPCWLQLLYILMLHWQVERGALQFSWLFNASLEVYAAILH